MPELSECKTCHKPVSTSAFSCPHCGEPFPTWNLSCPNCGGTNVSSIGQQQFSAGKAIGGAMLLGVLGLAAGAVGSKHIIFVCEQCGYRWKADPANLAVNTPLEIGDVLQGHVVEIIPRIRIDLGEGRWGTLMNLSRMNKKRKRWDKAPVSIDIDDEITVKITDKPLKASWAYMLGYAVVLAEDSPETREMQHE